MAKLLPIVRSSVIGLALFTILACGGSECDDDSSSSRPPTTYYVGPIQLTGVNQGQQDVHFTEDSEAITDSNRVNVGLSSTRTGTIIRTWLRDISINNITINVKRPGATLASGNIAVAGFQADRDKVRAVWDGTTLTLSVVPR